MYQLNTKRSNKHFLTKSDESKIMVRIFFNLKDQFVSKN